MNKNATKAKKCAHLAFVDITSKIILNFFVSASFVHNSDLTKTLRVWFYFLLFEIMNKYSMYVCMHASIFLSAFCHEMLSQNVYNFFTT